MGHSLLKMENIKKSFGKTQALDGVDLEVLPGEVHILLGENGAGKSTLMKILAGSFSADSGSLCWQDKEIDVRNPSIALKLGIGMVYQELAVVNDVSVFENVFLGTLPKYKYLPLIDWKKAQKKAKQLLADLGIDVDVKRPLREYDLGISQLVEIAKSISRSAKLLILDEPTSALTENETRNLFNAINRLKATGVSFIYITHKLQEVFTIGDRVTVLRDGKKVGKTAQVSDVCVDQLVEQMVGRTITDQYPKERNVRENCIFKVDNLSDGEFFNDVSFKLKEGEVLGVAGLVGSGTTEIVEAIYGLRAIKEGKLELYGKEYIPSQPSHSIQNQIGLLTKDRKGGLLLHMPIYSNITVSTPNKFKRWIFRNKKQEIKSANQFVEKLKIDTKSVKNSVSSLSGGNQQKVAIAKWLCSQSKIFIMDDPTRGIDVGAKVEVYKLINEITKNGAGVIFIASEMPELLGMSDRIIIARAGRIVGDLDIEECSQEIIIKKAAGGN